MGSIKKGRILILKGEHSEALGLETRLRLFFFFFPERNYTSFKVPYYQYSSQLAIPQLQLAMRNYRKMRPQPTNQSKL